MKSTHLKAALAALALLASGSAAADFGVGLKAGTLGLGVEARWDPPVPWFDLRVGFNQYDYDDAADYAGIDYDATLSLDNYYLTTNTTGEMASGGLLRSNMRVEVRVSGAAMWVAEAYTHIEGEEVLVQSYRFTR